VESEAILNCNRTADHPFTPTASREQTSISLSSWNCPSLRKVRRDLGDLLGTRELLDVGSPPLEMASRVASRQRFELPVEPVGEGV